MSLHIRNLDATLSGTQRRSLRETVEYGSPQLPQARPGTKKARKATSPGCASMAASDESGIAAVEFALIIPVLMFFVVSSLELGSVFNDFLVITNAAEAGTFHLTVSRGASTPYTSTVTAVKSSTYLSASQLTQLTVTVNVNGTPCATDSACQTALTNAAGQSATVTVSYPCDFTNLQIGNYQWNIPYCPLTSQSTGRIQ